MQGQDVTNSVIADKLREMANQADKNKFQKSNYIKAANNIRKSSVPITSGKQARGLFTGIGDSIMAKIDEIIATGSLQVLESRSPEELEKIKSMETFTSIYGVGPVLAEKWYNMGYRNFDQLSTIFYSMTDAQKLGYTHYKDINLKIPRQEIDWVNEYLTFVFGSQGIKFVISGSYRRGLPESSDIDVLVENKDSSLKLAGVVALLSAPGFIVATLALGDTTYRGLIRLSPSHPVRRLDIRLVDSKAWPFAILYFTGSKNFNITLRNRAISMGLSLSEYALTDQPGNQLPAVSEEDIFNILKVQFIAPADRTDNPRLIFTDMKPAETGKWYHPDQGFYIYIGDNVKMTSKIAGFDLDNTIITTNSGGFRTSAQDIILMPNRIPTLQKAIDQGYTIVIFTNQLSRSDKEFDLNMTRLKSAIELLNLPLILMSSIAKDQYRKSETGMWKYLISLYNAIDLNSSFYVGDAAGRPSDHSDSDLKFASAIGVSFYIPERIF